jgi:hypothetical protein
MLPLTGLQAQYIPAQGIALGIMFRIVCALKGQHINICWAYSPQNTRTFTTPSVAWGWDMKPLQGKKQKRI